MLSVSHVPRSLEKKTRLLGFELPDLLFIFLYLALSNLIFGQTNLKPLIVWVGTITLAGTLYFVKRGKPDGFIQHYGEFLYSPSVLSASARDLQCRPLFISHSTEDVENESSPKKVQRI